MNTQDIHHTHEIMLHFWVTCLKYYLFCKNVSDSTISGMKQLLAKLTGFTRILAKFPLCPQKGAVRFLHTLPYSLRRFMSPSSKSRGH